MQLKLSNQSFVERAPAEVVQRDRVRSQELADARTKLEALRRRFADAVEKH